MNIEDIDYPKFDAVRSLIDAQADNNPNISTAVKRVQAVSFDRLMHVFDLTMDDFRNVLATMISMDLNAIWKDRLSSSVSDTHLNDIDDNRFVKTLTKIIGGQLHGIHIDQISSSDKSINHLFFISPAMSDNYRQSEGLLIDSLSGEYFFGQLNKVLARRINVHLSNSLLHVAGPSISKGMF